MSGFRTSAPPDYTPPSPEEMEYEAQRMGLANFDPEFIADLCNLAEGGQFVPRSTLWARVLERVRQRTPPAQEQPASTQEEAVHENDAQTQPPDSTDEQPQAAKDSAPEPTSEEADASSEKAEPNSQEEAAHENNVQTQTPDSTDEQPQAAQDSVSEPTSEEANASSEEAEPSSQEELKLIQDSPEVLAAAEEEMRYHERMSLFLSEVDLNKFPGSSSLERAVSMLKLFESLYDKRKTEFNDQDSAQEEANELNERMRLANSLTSEEQKLLYDNKPPETETPPPEPKRPAKPKTGGRSKPRSKPKAQKKGSPTGSDSQQGEEKSPQKQEEKHSPQDSKLEKPEAEEKDESNQAEQEASAPDEGEQGDADGYKDRKSDADQPSESAGSKDNAECDTTDGDEQSDDTAGVEGPDAENADQKPTGSKGKNKGKKKKDSAQQSDSAGSKDDTDSDQDSDASDEDSDASESDADSDTADSDEESDGSEGNDGSEDSEEASADQKSSGSKGKSKGKKNKDKKNQDSAQHSDSAGSDDADSDQDSDASDGDSEASEDDTDSDTADGGEGSDGNEGNEDSEDSEEASADQQSSGSKGKSKGKKNKDSAQQSDSAGSDDADSDQDSDASEGDGNSDASEGDGESKDGSNEQSEESGSKSDKGSDEAEGSDSRGEAKNNNKGKQGSQSEDETEPTTAKDASDEWEEPDIRNWTIGGVPQRFQKLQIAEDLAPGYFKRLMLDVSRMLDTSEQVAVTKDDKTVIDNNGPEKRRRPIKDFSEIGKLAAHDLHVRSMNPALFNYKVVTGKFLVPEKFRRETKKQLIFILSDGSGSMHGERHWKASGIVMNRLKTVIAGDAEVWLSVFDTDLRGIDHASNEEEALALMKKYANRSFTGGGNDNGGCVLKAHRYIEELMKERKDLLRPEIWLITDDDATIRSLHPEQVKGTKVHGVAVGAPNPELRRFVTATGGTCWENV